ncbi:MAG: multifunctional oxoglutarate decarboxylase/oxoglutarate dehydrogenase thiamine pyrophosphate-binding subunit/dihydrolipoyllysine-residue succinyltransferase subunit, partial [Actinomycetia bacterium]|nr:multifunctional oxoglutarate decarboxylase/oxoglutarate dehydrogenase thiamine pyrophosphate-binding subunit/dihydrolipoyllysine-residue succinyltransferase subunit [Actinomycetes bacterium]
KVFTQVREATSAPAEYETRPDYPEKPETPGGTLDTSITPDTLKTIANAYTSAPEGFTVHPKVLPQLNRRAAAMEQGPIDWATGEILAIGSLLIDGRPVRLAGQDSRRGTFVQRFATIIDRKNASEWPPLSNLADGQASFYVYDSLLSEYAALGFEYGYSVARPEALTIWEAQFGDFVNGAQTIIDEYIVASETKWNQKSGVVLLLPHGYEGQGADHSSARIERFLDLAANDQMTIAQPSTPASHFHLLRQQNLRSQHRPLIVFTPKQLLRRKEAVSMPDDFTLGRFEPVIGDAQVSPSTVERMILCSGRVYYDLLAERAEREGDDPRTAIVRLERLYPRPVEEIQAELAKYAHLAEVRWVQDEPANQGPWPHMALHLSGSLNGLPFYRVSRPESSAPAVGQHSRHVQENKTLLQQAFA